MLPGAHRNSVPKFNIMEPKPNKRRGQDVVEPITWDGPLKAFCICGSKMMTTTSKDIRNGIQPRCDKCPQPKE